MQKIPALNHNKKTIHMWINSVMTLKLGTMSITKAIELNRNGLRKNPQAV